MVNTVLTDKTGTLTRNVMEFFKASIGGVSYGAGITEIERANALRRGIDLDIVTTGGRCARGAPPGGAVGASGSPVREQYFNFYDQRVMNGAWAAQPNPQLAREFFRMLALCHTVIPDGERVGGLVGAVAWVDESWLSLSRSMAVSSAVLRREPPR